MVIVEFREKFTPGFTLKLTAPHEASAAGNSFQKKKRKKRKRFQRGWMSGCKLFDLKIFLLKGSK
jgi:hypothetical protein